MWLSVYVKTNWNLETRSITTGSFQLYFNSRYDEIGSVCGEDLDDYEVEAPTLEEICESGSLI